MRSRGRSPAARAIPRTEADVSVCRSKLIKGFCTSGGLKATSAARSFQVPTSGIIVPYGRKEVCP